MKTFCVVHNDGSYQLIRATSVFEVEQTSESMELAIRHSLACKRPMSIIMRKGVGQTRFADRLPIKAAGRMFVKVKPHAEL